MRSCVYQMAHHQALSQHQTVATSGHQDVYQNRAITSNSSKTEENCKEQIKEEQRIVEVVHSNRDKSGETRLPVISMNSG